MVMDALPRFSITLSTLLRRITTFLALLSSLHRTILRSMTVPARVMVQGPRYSERETPLGTPVLVGPGQPAATSGSAAGRFFRGGRVVVTVTVGVADDSGVCGWAAPDGSGTVVA